jgi:hypothetical protein
MNPLVGNGYMVCMSSPAAFMKCFCFDKPLKHLTQQGWIMMSYNINR